MNKPQPQSALPTRTPRRTFLNRLWAAIGLFAGVELGWIGTTMLRFRSKNQPEAPTGTVIDAGTIQQYKPGTITPVPQGRVYIACLEDGGYLALSSTCTHLGCSLPWVEKEHKFICPCHGSTFDLRGVVLTAPATRALDIHPLRIENGVLKVDISRSVRRSSFDPAQVVRV